MAFDQKDEPIKYSSFGPFAAEMRRGFLEKKRDMRDSIKEEMMDAFAEADEDFSIEFFQDEYKTASRKAEANLWKEYRYVAAFVSKIKEEGKWTWKNYRKMVEMIFGSKVDLNDFYHDFKVVSGTLSCGIVMMYDRMKLVPGYRLKVKNSFFKMYLICTIIQKERDEKADEGDRAMGAREEAVRKVRHFRWFTKRWRIWLMNLVRTL